MLGFWHEMQDPTSVHITNAKKKKLEVLYDLLGSSQVASLRQRVAHIANPVFEFSVFFCTIIHLDLLSSTNPMDFLFNPSYDTKLLRERGKLPCSPKHTPHQGDQKHQELSHLYDKPCFLGSLAVQAPQVPNQQINVMVEESTMANAGISRFTLKPCSRILEWLEDNPNIVIKRKDCINGSNTFLDIQQISYGWPGSSVLQNGQCWHF
ncbi:hypothetical protein SUGI_0649580 [Cryptomeria japonica]|nr:hypothetical protein SUGI_0649580 [Cryptomeria japonica]